MELTRGIDPVLIDRLSSGAPVYPILLVYLDWPTGAVRVHSNAGAVEFQGETWTGVGNFGEIELPAAKRGAAQSKAVMRLVGSPAEIAALFGEFERGRLGEIWFGLTERRGAGDFVGEPFRLYAGYMDAIAERGTRRGEDGITRAVQLRLASSASQRINASLYHSPEEIADRTPGDTGGRLLLNATARANSVIEWG